MPVYDFAVSILSTIFPESFLNNNNNNNNNKKNCICILFHNSSTMHDPALIFGQGIVSENCHELVNFVHNTVR